MSTLQTVPKTDLVKRENGWLLTEENFCVENNRKYEGLFTLGSGRLHIRGSLEEHLLDAPQHSTYMRMPANVTAEEFPKTKAKWGTYIPGIYGKHPFLNNELINLPSFIGLRPFITGKGAVDLESRSISNFKRTLDMQSAVLSHSYKWKPEGQDTQIEVCFERFVSAVHRDVVIQRLTLCANKNVSIDLESWIDGDVRTNGFDHFKELEFSANDNGELDCIVQTDLNDTVMIRSCHNISTGWQAKSEQRAARAFLSCKLEAGTPLVIEKRSAVSTSRDTEHRSPTAILNSIAGLTFDELLTEHKKIWQAFWDKSDVQVEGHDDSQTALRASIYHLLRAQVSGDKRVAIDAKGYAGEGYFGRFFWDTEMFLHPFFAYTDINRARELVEFRIETLAGARRNASRLGYSGACYAWESDAKGDECCMLWQYRDHEVHITGDVVYALAHQAAAAGEDLNKMTKTVILETARYWKDRIDWRAGDSFPSLLGVMGPDEYSPLGANNAYTNRLVRLTFDLASKYGAEIGATSEECNSFSRLATLLPLPKRADGLFLQSEIFEYLAEPNFDKKWLDKKRPYAAQVSQERLYRSKNLKQADVLMLMFLFPGEFSDSEVRQAWEYYVPVTTHDSSLSAGIHSIIASRLGLEEEAWQFWLKSAFLDLDLSTEAAAEGIHIAGSGANWMTAVCGFAGFRYAIQSDTLTFNPCLPKQWKRLSFPLNWRGQQILVDITDKKFVMHNTSTKPLDFCLSGHKHTVFAGEEKSFEIEPKTYVCVSSSSSGCG